MGEKFQCHNICQEIVVSSQLALASLHLIVESLNDRTFVRQKHNNEKTTIVRHGIGTKACFIVALPFHSSLFT